MAPMTHHVLAAASAVAAVSALKTHSSIAAPYRQSLENMWDLQYYAKLSLGGQELNTIMDTGSVELVVISDICPNCGDKKQLYHPKESQHHTQGKYQLRQSYGSGDLMGMEAYDELAIGPRSVNDVPFWEAFDARMPLLESSNFQVIFGVGPIPANVTFMKIGSSSNAQAYAIPLHALEIERLGVCLGRKLGSPGFFIWDDDSAKVDSQLFLTMNVQPTGYWMVPLANVRLGDTPIGCVNKKCGAVLDSGTSLLAMPSAAKSLFESTIDALGAGCHDVDKVPNLYFTLDGQEFSLPPDTFFGELVGAAMKQYNQTIFERSAKRACGASLMNVNMDGKMGDVWILGMPFFREFYSVFEQGSYDGSRSPTISISRASSHCTPLSSPSTPAPTNVEEEQRSNLGWGTGRARRVDASKLQMGPWLHRVGGAFTK